ncbi:MAG: hypothetical protein ACOC7V_07280 [Spirochaetota bacterium]
MSARPVCRLVLIVAAVIVALTGCMDGFVITVNEIVADENAPGGFPEPAAGSLIAPDDDIRVRYNRSMAPESLVLEGSLAEAGTTVRWESVLDPNDTVVLSPVTSWPVFDELSIRLTAASAEGYPARTLEASFTALNDEYHVAAGATGGTGAPDAPFGTIDEALELAARRRDEGYRGIQTIKVAGGTYAESITIAPGVTIRGGYEADFAARVPRTSVLTGEADSEATVLVGAVTGSVATGVLDGFEVQQPPGDPAVAAIIIESGPVSLVDVRVHSVNEVAVGVSGARDVRIEDSHLSGPATWEGSEWWSSDYFSSFNLGFRTALFVESGTVTVVNTTIDMPGDAPASSLMSATVRAEDDARLVLERSTVLAPSDDDLGAAAAVAQTSGADVEIVHSLVDGGSGEEVRALYADSGNLAVRNSTIRVGEATSTSGFAPAAGIEFAYYLGGDLWGVPSTTGNSLLVQNCIVFGQGEPDSTGIFHGELAVMQNNLFFAVHSASVYGEPIDVDFSERLTAAGMNAEPEIAARDNADGVDPELVSPVALSDPAADWSLTAATPASVADGGYDLADEGVAAVDRAGAVRPAGSWSIGAYEYE